MDVVAGVGGSGVWCVCGVCVWCVCVVCVWCVLCVCGGCVGREKRARVSVVGRIMCLKQRLMFIEVIPRCYRRTQMTRVPSYVEIVTVSC